jgi:hypothetical protein
MARWKAARAPVTRRGQESEYANADAALVGVLKDGLTWPYAAVGRPSRYGT